MINKQVDDIQKFCQYFTENQLDCIVSPGFPLPAFKHGQSRLLQYCCIYTFLFNVLDLPTFQIPVSTVRPEEER